MRTPTTTTNYWMNRVAADKAQETAATKTPTNWDDIQYGIEVVAVWVLAMVVGWLRIGPHDLGTWLYAVPWIIFFTAAAIWAWRVEWPEDNESLQEQNRNS